MSKQFNQTSAFKALGAGIILIQLFDLLIHAATNQLEILRVSSNIILLLWLAVTALGRYNTKFLSLAVGSIGGYLALNFIFLALEGVTNVEQGGELRGMLFLLMSLTVAASFLLIHVHKRFQSG